MCGQKCQQEAGNNNDPFATLSTWQTPIHSQKPFWITSSGKCPLTLE